MSLLGRLLSGATGSSTATLKNSLESTVDTQFSYSLLFPEPEALSHNDQVFPLSSGTILPSAGINFDLNAELDMEMRDVRVIIMQESNPLSGSAYLLYDSHAPPPPPSTSPLPDRQNSGSAAHPSREARRSISSPRKGSLGHISKPVVIQQEPAATAPRTFGAFDRRPSHNKTLSYTETDGQRSAREYREEVTTFSNCIFGTSEVLAYKGTGTKVHILPTETKHHTFAPSSYAGEGSLGRSSMRSSRLAQSFTSESIAGPTSAGFTSPTIPSRGGDRKRVLITRMFPVTLPNDDPDEAIQDRTPTGQAAGNQNSGYPFPQVEHGIQGERKKLQPKQKRTPMYAVGLVVTLPPAPYAPLHTSRSSFRAPSSYTEQESMPNSFNSTRRAGSGWTMLGHGFGVESLDSSYSSEVEDRIDIITHHWDIIMRTLSHLQAASTSALLPMLKQADISSPDPRRESFSHHRAASASVSVSGKRVAEEPKTFKPPKTNAKLVQLVSNCLMGNQVIQNEVDASRQRILSGLKATQVVTGQGRWGIWRQEARLVHKWAGGKNEGFFFFNLLTGFLGNHTEWIQALGPSWYRRRHYQQQRANKDDDISLPARTVIISDNKVMARRLIFLLSAFLPANQYLPSPRVHRPSTSTSFGGYSQSPTESYAVPIMREESLRRKINKRGSTSGFKTTHARTSSFPAQASFGRIPLDIHHDRRPSDATSIRTANLPIPGSDIGTRKSSAATIGTASPVTTMPHFSSARRPVRGTGPIARPGSSGSLATDDLMRSLKRDSSSHKSNVSTDSQGQGSGWGSMMYGFWGVKRRDSSASTPIEPLSIEGLEITESPYTTSTSQKGKLAQMVDEVNIPPHQKTMQQKEREARRSDGSNTTARPEEDQNEEDGNEEEKAEDLSQTLRTRERVHDPSGAYQSPVKTSINERDGVIDIDVPLPDYLAFETAVSSPSSSGYLSTPGFGNGMEGFEHYSRAGPDSETALNVGGWLPRFHPDFAVHAIPSSSSAHIVEEIKESMRAEPTPILSYTPHFSGDRWIDISSAVIADTTNFSIKHILYRRLIRVRKTTADTTPSLPNSFDSRYGNVYHSKCPTPGATSYDGYIDEKFIEEPIISLDETLVDAVERIIAQSGDVSKNSSVCSSTATSRRGSTVNLDVHPTSAPMGTTPPVNTRTPAPTHLEVPRNECKRIVLSALEDIVREVVDGRRDGGIAGGGESVDGARERGLERGESFLREGVRVWLEGVEGGN